MSRARWPAAVAAALVLCPLAAPALAQLPFTPAVIDASFHGDCKAVADFDGDGSDDVAVAGAGGLRWYRSPAWTPTDIAAPLLGEFTTDMQAADVDGDGDPDLVVPDLNAGVNVYWFENPRPGGDPALAAWSRHGIGAFGWAHDLEAGDIDGDGRIDVVTRQGATALWLQTAPDVWTRVDLPAALPGGEGVGLGDIDRDGDLDLALNGYWLECPAAPAVGADWIKHPIVAGWPDLCGARVADVDRDGRPDVILAASEGAGRMAWFQGPLDPRSATAWSETAIDASVDFVHTFQVVDLDRDGALDVVFAEMAQSARGRVGIYYNRLGGASWTLQVLSTTGSHNVRVGDLDGDGDVDVMGANWQGPPVEWWQNGLPPCTPRLDAWSYVEVDRSRAAWGDWDTPSWAKYFGLGLGDLTGDGLGDIVSGRYFYRNPGGGMAGPWPRVDLGVNCDAHSILDVDGDALGDVIASAGGVVLWLEARDAQGSSWAATTIDPAFPKPGHGNPQGYAVAEIVGGGRPEVLLATDAGGDLLCYEVPASPASGAWPRTAIVTQTNGEGIGTGDIDRDGRVDVVVAHEPPGWTPADPRWIKWAKNPGDGSGGWATHLIGTTDGSLPDRVAAGDLNGDGRLDVVVTEEEQPVQPTWKSYWFEAPLDPVAGAWTRRTIVTQYTTNSLDLADMDGDGDLDVVLAEHRGDQTLAVWENDGLGNFTERVVDTGKESHLGARVADLDGDGDLEIASIAWDAHPFLHLWRNDGGCGGQTANRRPVVAAGPDQVLLLPARIAGLEGSASDDGLPSSGRLTSRWSQVSGPGTAVFADASAPRTTATFDLAGDYVLRLEASDGELSAFDELQVSLRPFASDLLLHWTLDDGVGTQAMDSTAWGNHGTLAGGVWGAGVVRGGLELDGVSQHVARASAALAGPFPATPAQGDAFTVAAWIRIDSVDRRHPIAGKQGNQQRGFLFLVEDDNRLALEVFQDDVVGSSVRGTTALAAGSPRHVAATYEFRGAGASIVRLYLDGVLDGSSTTAAGPLAANSTAFEAGRYWWSAAYSVYLDGLLDDVRVHGRALGACELARLATGSFDVDADELPDAWETASLGGLGPGPGDDGDGDGEANLDEYVAGSDPADPASRGLLLLARGAAGEIVARFATRVAVGPGYECETRFYDVTLAADVRSGPWAPAVPCTGVSATGAPATCAFAGAAPLDFVRLRPRLER